MDDQSDPMEERVHFLADHIIKRINELAGLIGTEHQVDVVRRALMLIENEARRLRAES